MREDGSTQRRKSVKEAPNWPGTDLQSVSDSLSYHQVQYCDEEGSAKNAGLSPRRTRAGEAVA